jgi:hypothetical protein
MYSEYLSIGFVLKVQSQSVSVNYWLFYYHWQLGIMPSKSSQKNFLEQKEERLFCEGRRPTSLA